MANPAEPPANLLSTVSEDVPETVPQTVSETESATPVLIPKIVRRSTIRQKDDRHVASAKKNVKHRALAGVKTGIKHEHVPAIVWAAIAKVEKDSHAAVKAGGRPLAGNVRKQVVVSTVEDILDEFRHDNVTDGDKNSIKMLIPGFIDLIVAIVQGRDPDIKAFFTSENVGALGKLCKKIACCLPCCKKCRRAESSDDSDSDIDSDVDVDGEEIPADIDVAVAVDVDVDVVPAAIPIITSARV